MDFVGTAWLGYINDVQTSCLTDTGQEIGLNHYLIKMKKLLKKKSNLHWHVDFLQQYARDNLSPVGLRVQIFPSFQNTGTEFKIAWEKILTQCSTDLIKLLISHHQAELALLDEEIITFQTKNDNLKSHTQFNHKWQEVREYITKINRDIIFKKQNKFMKDKTAFMEGCAYHWQTPSHNRRPRKTNPKKQHPNNGSMFTDDDTEIDSDSSLSTFSSQAPIGKDLNVTPNDTGARKRQYGGGHYTPYPKKKIDKQDIKRSNGSLRQGPSSIQGGGTDSQSKYIGPNAHKALQMLNQQNRINPTPTTFQSGPGRDTSNTSFSNNTHTNVTQQPIFSNPLNSVNSVSLTQSQNCRKQSTLDPHIVSNATSTINFPMLGIPPPHT